MLIVSVGALYGDSIFFHIFCQVFFVKSFFFGSKTWEIFPAGRGEDLLFSQKSLCDLFVFHG